MIAARQYICHYFGKGTTNAFSAQYSKVGNRALIIS